MPVGGFVFVGSSSLGKGGGGGGRVMVERCGFF